MNRKLIIAVLSLSFVAIVFVSAPVTATRPLPGAADQEQLSADSEMRALAKQQLAAERTRHEREDKIINAFAERLQPAVEAAEKKIGFDRKAIEAEFKAIASESDDRKRLERFQAARQKFEPQVIRLYQAAGINVAEERQRLINELGLQNARIKPSKTLTIEIEPDPVATQTATAETPADEVRFAHASRSNGTVSPQLSFTYHLRPPFLIAGSDSDYEDGGISTVADRNRGEISAHHDFAFAVSAGSAAWMATRFEAKPSERRIMTTTNLRPLGVSLFAASIVAGYASSEAFVTFSVVHRGGGPGCQQRFTMGRVIAVIWGFPDSHDTVSSSPTCGFPRAAIASEYQANTMVELYSGAAGYGWVYSNIWSDISEVTARTFAR